MFPNLLHFFWLLLQFATAFSLLIPALFCAVYFFISYLKKQPSSDNELHEEKDYAIIVPAPGKGQHIQTLLHSLQCLNYTNYIIYVAGRQTIIADAGIHKNQVVYLRTSTCHDNQTLFYRFVIENFRRPHTHLVVLNGNQLVEENYLTRLNTFFNLGYQAVKSNEAVENGKTLSPVLQSAIDAYRNFFAGKMIFGLGSSATLSSSGIAFGVTFYKQCLKKIKADDSDFASALQRQIMKRGHQVAFASQAIVYSNEPLLKKELATRHAMRIHSWLINLLFYCKTAVKGLMRGNANQFLYSVLSIRLPLPTSILAAMACLVVNVRIYPAVSLFWAGSLLLVPVYFIVARQQVSKQSNQNSFEQIEEEPFESVPLYEQEDNYSAIAQTV